MPRLLEIMFATSTVLSACSAEEHCPGGTSESGERCIYPKEDVDFPAIGADAVVLITPAPDTSEPDDSNTGELGIEDGAAPPDGEAAEDTTNADGSATDTEIGESADEAGGDTPAGTDADDAAASDDTAGIEADVEDTDAADAARIQEVPA